VYDVWAEGNAEVGEDVLSLVVEVNTDDSESRAAFVLTGIQRRMQSAMNAENPLSQIFLGYDVTVVFSSAYKDTIRDRAQSTQDSEEYYELTRSEFINI